MLHQLTVRLQSNHWSEASEDAATSGVERIASSLVLAPHGGGHTAAALSLSSVVTLGSVVRGGEDHLKLGAHNARCGGYGGGSVTVLCC